MNIEYKKVSGFDHGILFELLKDSYSFDNRYEENCYADWLAFDNFFFNNLQIADRYGFITTLNGEAIGFISWDPRNKPEYVQIGYNCITSKHKSNGYGKMQLQEAVNRITLDDVRKIIVTTDDILVPAQRMYESVGFIASQKRKSQNDTNFVNEHIDYVYYIKSI